MSACGVVVVLPLRLHLSCSLPASVSVPPAAAPPQSGHVGRYMAPFDRRPPLIAMVLLQSGFLANEAAGDTEPNNSHQLASALPVPVSSAVALSRPCAGGWGFALAAASDHIYAWGVNQATIIAKAGGNDDGADPTTLDEVADGVTAAAAGFDHGLLVQGGKVLVFGPAFRPPAAALGLHLSPVPFKVTISQVAAGEAWRWGGQCVYCAALLGSSCSALAAGPRSRRLHPL